MEVPDRPSLRFGTGEFSASLWLNADPDPDDQPGGILCKYDPAARRGFLLSLATNRVNTARRTCATSTSGLTMRARMPSGRIAGVPAKPLWYSLFACMTERCMRPPVNRDRVRVGASIGTRAAKNGSTAHPRRLELCSGSGFFRWALYAGTARYNTQGSALPASANETPGGKVTAMKVGSGGWTAANSAQSAAVYSLVSYRGKLHEVRCMPRRVLSGMKAARPGNHAEPGRKAGERAHGLPGRSLRRQFRWCVCLAIQRRIRVGQRRGNVRQHADLWFRDLSRQSARWHLAFR